MSNEFIRIPKTGDICLKRISDRKVLYIAQANYDNSSIDTATYEVIGGVLGALLWLI